MRTPADPQARPDPPWLTALAHVSATALVTALVALVVVYLVIRKK